jgi:hypothetical protein
MSICMNIKAAGEAFGSKQTASVILPYYLKYLKDPEPEVCFIFNLDVAKRVNSSSSNPLPSNM